MNRKEGGATPTRERGQTMRSKCCFEVLPRNVPIKNGHICTPRRGDAMFINQFGKNGVIRKNII